MKRKGFTLIELLGVIIVLAIIALIATPTILGVIEKVRKGAAESSTLGYIDAIEKQIIINETNNDKTPVNDGIYNIEDIEISYKGETPEQAIVEIEKGIVNKGFFLVNDYYICYSNNKAVASKNETDLTDCSDINGNILYKETILNGADPQLKDELIPVTIENNGTVKKADLNTKWYSYEEKKWANAVILKDSFEKLTNEGKVYGASKQNGYISFDGQDDYMDLGLENYDFGNNVTMAIKVLFKSNSQQTFFNNFEFGGIGFRVYSDGKIHFQIYNSEINDYAYVEGPAIELNKEYTIVGTYDGITLKLFIDGSLYGSVKSVGKVGVSSMPITIGTNLNEEKNTYYSYIDVYETAIYDRVLAEEEVEKSFKNDIKIYDDTNLLLYENFTSEYSDKEIIPEENIESYFVWVPRYKYKLFDLGEYTSSVMGKPGVSIAHPIEIVFGTDTTSDENSGECTTPLTSGETGNCELGEYMTHPAFITMNKNGLWVGKFETGYDGATTTIEAEINSSDSNKIIVKPNVYSWRSNTASNIFAASYNYNRNLNSHMMKNTEWGAVAYLSHSIYGINKEINVNNNSIFLTGYSAVDGIDQSTYPGTAGTDQSVTLAYNTETGYKASTTGNITGIYDMSGGTHERMSSYVDGYYEDSGFDVTTIADYDSKYFDIYSSNSTHTSYNNRILGDATGEMGPFYYYQENNGTSYHHNNWYADLSVFVEASLHPWFSRGGLYNDGIFAGQFYSLRTVGGADYSLGSHLVLAG